MKTQFIFLIVVLVLNLTIALAFSLETTDGEPLIPGTKYTQPINTADDLDDYVDQYNASEVMGQWEAKVFDGVPILGDIFSGTSQFWNMFGFLIDGVPSLINWFGSFLPSSQSIFTLIANVIRVITAVLFVTLIIELISGRELLP